MDSSDLPPFPPRGPRRFLDSDLERVRAALEKALDTGDLERARDAVRALGFFGAPARSAVPLPLRALDVERLRFETARTLARLQSEPGRGIPLLIRALDSGDPDRVKEASITLGRPGPAAGARALVRLLRSESDGVRVAAGGALADPGPGAVSVLPSIVAELLHGRPSQGWAFNAFWSFGPQAVPALIELLQSPEEDVRLEAARVLGSFGEEAAKEAVPALRRCLRAARFRHPTRILEAAKVALRAIERWPVT